MVCFLIQVLRNLRLWDEYVFHRAPPKIFLEPPTTNSSTGWSQQPKKFKGTPHKPLLI